MYDRAMPPRMRAWQPGKATLPRRFLDREEPVGRNTLERLLDPAGPADFDRIDFGLRAQPEMYALVARGHEADADGHVVVQYTSGCGGEFDLGSDGVARAFVPDQVEHQPMIARAAGVHQDARRLVQGGHHDIQGA